MDSLRYLVVIGTTIWVAFDTKKIGVKAGRLGGGFFDVGRWTWVFACLILWIVAFPVYLGKRSEYIRLNR